MGQEDKTYPKIEHSILNIYTFYFKFKIYIMNAFSFVIYLSLFERGQNRLIIKKCLYYLIHIH